MVPGDQNLEVKTESQSLAIESGKPGCWTTRSIKTFASPGASIVICTGSYCTSHQLADNDEDRIVTAVLSIREYGNPSQNPLISSPSESAGR